MTRNEAFLEMASAGRKVKHKWFMDNEYLYMVDDVIYTENGFDFTSQFWFINSQGWQTNWDFYDKIIKR